MHFAVGQVWVVHHLERPGSHWHFQIVAETHYAGQPYYVALKLGVYPDSLQAVVFDQHGQTVEAGPFRYNFVCVRRSRRKPEVLS